MNNLQSLRFWIDEQPTDVPSWASFYLKVGVQLARKKAGAFVAILVPNRTLASSLLTTGFVIEKVESQTVGKQVHFETLKKLDSGHPVMFLGSEGMGLKDDRRYKGRLRRANGQLSVQTDKATKHLISNPRKALAVEPLSEEVEIPKTRRGSQISSENTFVERVLSNVDMKDILMRCEVRCSIIGTKSDLEQEMEELKIAIEEDGNVATGSLKSLAKPRALAGGQKNYWSDISSFYGMEKPNVPKSSEAIIHDRVTGFIRWSGLEVGKNTHQVAVLERRHRRFDEAVDLIKEKAFTRNRALDLSNIPKLPPGVEVVSFRP